MVNCFYQFPYSFVRLSQVAFFGKHCCLLYPHARGSSVCWKYVINETVNIHALMEIIFGMVTDKNKLT